MTPEVDLLLRAITAIALLTSAIALIYSVIRAAKALEANNVNFIYSEMHEIHRAFIQHPHLREYFHSNRPMDLDKKDAEYLRARSIAELYFDTFEHIWIANKRRPKRDRENWEKYIASMCEDSIFLSRYLEEVGTDIYPETLRKFIVGHTRSAIARYQSQIDPPHGSPSADGG